VAAILTNSHNDIELLTVAQVAAALQVSQRTIWRSVSNGIFPAPIKLGGRIARWKRSDIYAHIEKQAGGLR